MASFRLEASAPFAMQRRTLNVGQNVADGLADVQSLDGESTLGLGLLPVALQRDCG